MPRPAFPVRPARQWTANEPPGARVPFPRVKPVPRQIVTIAKSEPTRDEAYRRLVALLPCACCGVETFSQAAHGPTLGGAIKSNDTDCFPLCCDRPGIKGCHPRFDQYELFDGAEARALAAVRWAAEARLLIEGVPA